jgi:hypothetical protein
MPKVKVIEISGIKLDPHAEYLIAVNVQSLLGDGEGKYNSLDSLDKELRSRIGDKVTILPVVGRVSNNIKVFQIPKEITISQEIKLDGK